MHLWSEIGAPFETALARMGIAQAHRAESNEECALLEFQAARSTFEQIGAMQQAERAARACAQLGDGAEPESCIEKAFAVQDNVFRREGNYWTVAFAGHTLLLRDGKGLRYLAWLLADPGREFHVLDLVAVEHGCIVDVSRATVPGLAFSALGDAGEMLDARAKDAYRRRLAEIEEDIEEARAMGDIDRETQADTERNFLVRELSRAIGLGGRDRRAGSASERARVSVTRAVRSAMTRIREHNPHLGEHLDRSIRTGTCCAYLPDSRMPAAWKL